MDTSGSTVLPLLIAFGGVLTGVIFMFVGWCLWFGSRDLRKNGCTVTATVLEKFRKHDPGLRGMLENYYVRCWFQDTTGMTHEIDVPMQSKRWFQVREGNKTQLTFVPNDPEETQSGSKLGWQIRGIIGVGLLVLGGLISMTSSVSGFRAWLSIVQSI